MSLHPVMDAGLRPVSYARYRRNLNYRAIAYIAAIFDFAYLLGASATGFIAYEYIAFRTFSDPSLYIGMGLVLATTVVLAMHCASAYRSETLVIFGHQVRLISLLVPSAMAFLLAVIFFLKLGDIFSRGSILSTVLIATGGLIAIRHFWTRYLPWALANGSFRMRKVLLICHDDFPVDEMQIEAASAGMRLAKVMHFAPDGSLPAHATDIWRTDDNPDVDEVLVIWRGLNTAQLESGLSQMRRSTLPVSVTFEGFVGQVVSGTPQVINRTVAFQTQKPPLKLYERSLKRIFDIVFSLFVLVTLMPFLAFVAVAIKLESVGPFLFLQLRKGYGGRSFRIFKFRSMTVLEDGHDVRQATRGDPRITRVGAFIRATSIDEMPQFWNVLRGEMSVVGPRPHAVVHDDLYDARIAKYAYRRHMKPGLTGWAQVNNCRGETPTIESMEERVRHDLWYINNWSFWLDVKIICLTVFKISDFKGVH